MGGILDEIRKRAKERQERERNPAGNARHLLQHVGMGDKDVAEQESDENLKDNERVPVDIKTLQSAPKYTNQQLDQEVSTGHFPTVEEMQNFTKNGVIPSAQDKSQVKLPPKTGNVKSLLKNLTGNFSDESTSNGQKKVWMPEDVAQNKDMQVEKRTQELQKQSNTGREIKEVDEQTPAFKLARFLKGTTPLGPLGDDVLKRIIPETQKRDITTNLGEDFKPNLQQQASQDTDDIIDGLDLRKHFDEKDNPFYSPVMRDFFATSLKSALEPILNGVNQVNRGMDEKRIMPKLADMVLGYTGTLMNSIPQVIGINAINPGLKHVVGDISEDLGGTREAGETAANYMGIAAFGKKILLASLGSGLLENVAQGLTEGKDLSNDDKERIIEVAGQLGFFGTLGLQGSGAKSFMKSVIDKSTDGVKQMMLGKDYEDIAASTRDTFFNRMMNQKGREKAYEYYVNHMNHPETTEGEKSNIRDIINKSFSDLLGSETRPEVKDEMIRGLLEDNKQQEKAQTKEVDALKETVPEKISPTPLSKGDFDKKVKGLEDINSGFRVESGYKHERGTKAIDVVKFEEDELGNDNSVSPWVKKELEKYNASDLVWLTKTPEDAQKYAMHEGEKPEPVILPGGSKIIGEDGEGGYLVLKGGFKNAEGKINEGTKQKGAEKQSDGSDKVLDESGKLRKDEPDEKTAKGTDDATAKAKNKEGKKPVKKGEVTADQYKKAKDLLKRVKGEEVKKAEEKPKEVSSTQVNVPAKQKKPFIDFAKSIPKKDLYKPETQDQIGGYGAETEPHVTALFGLHTMDPKEVEKVVKGHGDIELTLGKTSLFKNDEFDVLKVDVTSPQLTALHKKLRDNLEYTNDHPDYHPHLTIAYLKPGKGEKYTGDTRFEGKKIKVSELLFSDKDRNKTPIKLAKEKAVTTKDTKKKPVDTKNAYEMTQGEFRLDKNIELDGDVKIVKNKPKYNYKTEVNYGGGKRTFQIETRGPLSGDEQAERLHKQIVKQAIIDGLPVSAKVLKDYPEFEQLNQIHKQETGFTRPEADAKAKEKSKKEKIDEEIDDLEDRIRKRLGKLTSGFDPELFALNVELVGKYLKKGLFKLQEILGELYNKYGEAEFRDWFDYVKKAYSGYMADENVSEADLLKMDKLADIRKMKIDDVLEGFKKGKTIQDKLSHRTPEEVKIIEHYIKGKPTAEELDTNPVIVLTGGLPGAGKSTGKKLSGKNEVMKVAVQVDSDEIKSHLEGTADETHEMSSELAKDLLNIALDSGYHVVYDSQLTNYPEVKSAIEKTLEKEGKAHILFTYIDPFTSKVRTQARLQAGETTREIPEDAIIKGFNRALPTFLELLKNYEKNDNVDITIIDNNVDGMDPQLIYQKVNGITEIRDDKSFENLKKIDYIPVGEGKDLRYERTEKFTKADLAGKENETNARISVILDLKRQAERESEIKSEEGEVSDGINDTGLLSGDRNNSGLDSDSEGSLDEVPADNVPKPPKKGGTGKHVEGSSRTDTGSVQDSESETSGTGDERALSEDGGLGEREGNGDNNSRRTASRNYVIKKDSAIVDKTFNKNAKTRSNLTALQILKQLETENRNATSAEQDALVKYVGWGGVPDIFDEAKSDWSEQRKQLKDLLSEREYEEARASTLNAHYTSPVVIRAMYKALERLGFKGGRFLEPALGTGHFFGLMPVKVRSNSKLYGVELDTTTGRIAKKLYPNAKIDIKGYQEVVKYPDGYFDVSMSNVPFGDYPVQDSKYPKDIRRRIHNYFFAKTLDQVKEGGIVAFITSKGTLDSKDDTIRKYIYTKANILGAIRLPNTTFGTNANTKVVTDIIFLQKETNRGYINEWNNPIKQLHDFHTSDGKDIRINEYFVEHPEMMVGDMVVPEHSGMYGANEPTLIYKGKNFEKDLLAAVEKLPDNIYTNQKNPIPEIRTPREEEVKEDGIPDGAFLVRDGDIYRKVNNVVVKQEIKDVQVKDKMIRQMRINELARDVLRTQMASSNDEDFADSMAALNKEYDDYVKKYGILNDKKNRAILKDAHYGDDPNRAFVLSLENYNDDKNEATKSDRFSKRTVYPTRDITSTDTVQDALAVTLNSRGKLDVDEIQKLINKPYEEVIDDLKKEGLIYLDKGKWIAADEYLSGNVRRKLKDAEISFEETQNPELQRNIEGLKAVQPKDLQAGEIGISLGATWVEPEDYKAFITELIGEDGNLSIKYIAPTSEWQVSESGRYGSLSRNAKNISEFGTDEYPATRLLETALNNHVPRVYDRFSDGTSKVNPDKTAAAQEKMQKLKAQFDKWIWNDSDRAGRLVKKYNENFNNLRVREYDGKHLVLPGINPDTAKRLFPHVKDAVWRIIQQRDVLLAHDVGFGKTWSMSIGAMELRRLGLAKKPLHVIKNHMVGQYMREFASLYPEAKLLVISPEDFEKSKRSVFMSRIANGDWDSVIVAYSAFERLPLHPDTMGAFLNEQIKILEDYIYDMKGQEGSRMTVKQMEKAKKKLETKLKEIIDNAPKDKSITFEETGVDALFVDEAHNYKNLFFPTKLGNLPGLSKSSANRSMDMYAKISHIRNNYGKGIVLATGTPVSNTMAELYTMQRYMQPELLKEYGIDHFDSWVNTFGEIATKYELNILGTGIRLRTRLATFRNIPEIMSMFRLNADVKTKKSIRLNVPNIKGGKAEVVTAPATKELKAYVKSLGERYEAVMQPDNDPRIDNPLKITNDGRKAAVDLRLVGINIDHPDSKINQSVKKMFDIWKASKSKKSTQIAFLDLGTPSSKNINLYADIKKKLVARGIPADEIAFIHSATNEEKKAKLFKDMNTGAKRILIGSTQKMGEGTNIQNKLIAYHRIDAPWRPSDIEQGIGRIVRSGNENAEVFLQNYVTEGSFDAYIWQLLENKIRFVTQAMTNDLTVRSAEDIESRALTYAEVKAIATGNPLILERFKITDELMKLDALRREYFNDKMKLQSHMAYLPGVIKDYENRIKKYEQDKIDVPPPEEFEMNVNGKGFNEIKAAGEEITKFLKDYEKSPGRFKLGDYLGFKINAEIKQDRKLDLQSSKLIDYRDVGVFDIGLVGKSGQNYEAIYREEIGPDMKGPVEIVKSIRSAIKKIADKIDEANAIINRDKKEIVDYKEQLEKPFEYEQKYEELTKNLKAIEDELGSAKDDAGTSEAEESEEGGSDKDLGSVDDKTVDNSDKWFIQTREGFRETEGKPVSFEGFDNFEFFAHKFKDKKTDEWRITEASTGRMISSGNTKADAMISATAVLNKQGPEALAKALEMSEKSPRANPNKLYQTRDIKAASNLINDPVKIEKFKADLQKKLKQVGVKDVSVKLDFIPNSTTGVRAGYWDPQKRELVLNNRMLFQDTPDHEWFHLATDVLGERKMWDKLLTEAGWNGEGRAGDNKSWVDAQEKLANEYADWVKNENNRPKSKLNDLWSKVREFFSRMFNFFKGQGFSDKQAVFADLFRGKFKAAKESYPATSVSLFDAAGKAPLFDEKAYEVIGLWHFQKGAKDFNTWKEKMTDDTGITQESKLKGIFEKVGGRYEEDERSRSRAYRVLVDEHASEDLKTALTDTDYDVIHNVQTEAEVKEMIEKAGLDAAIDEVLDKDSTLDPRVRVMASTIIRRELELERRKLSSEGKNTEAQAILNKQLRLTRWELPFGTTWGQAIQAFAAADKYTPEGAMKMAVKVLDESRGRSQQEIDDQIDTIKESLERINAEASDKVITELKDEINKIVDKISKERRKLPGDKEEEPVESKPEDKAEERKEKDRAAQMLAKKIRVEAPNPAKTDPVWFMVNTLYDIAKGKGLVPDYQKPPPAEKLIQLIGNAVKEKEGYRDVWDRAKTLVDKKYKNNPEALEMLDQYFKHVLKEPFSDKQAEKVIKTGIKELDKKIVNIVKEHYSASDNLGKTLEEKLIQEAGLLPDEADILVKKIREQYKKLTDEAKNSVLKQKFSTPGFKLKQAQWKKIVELSNLGAPTNETYKDLFAEKFGMRNLTVENADMITDLANKVQESPEGFQRDKKTTELMNYIKNLAKSHPTDYFWDFYYSSIISGLKTLTRIVRYNALVSGMDFFFRKPTEMPGAVLALAHGLYRGILESTAVIKEGDFSQLGHELGAQGMYERKPLSFFGSKKLHNLNPINWAKLAGRNIIASHRIGHYPLKEMESYGVARDLAIKKGLKGKELSAEIRNILYNSKEQVKAAKEQARKEGLTGLNYRRRIYEIMEQKRPATLEAEASRYALKRDLLAKPEGTAGQLYSALVNLQTRGATKTVRFLIQFARITLNLTNMAFDFTPYGFKRAFFGYGYGKAHEDEPYQREKHKEFLRALTGSLMMVGLGMAVLGKDDDADLDLSADGTGDFKKNEQLMAKGWRPYSVKIGGAWWSYLHTPFFLPLMAVGMLRDMEKYKKEKDADAWTKASLIVFNAIDATISHSVLSGFNDFTQNFLDPEKRESFIRRWSANTASVIIPNAVKDVVRMIDDKSYDADTWTQIFERQSKVATFTDDLKPKINVLGEEIHADPLFWATKPDKSPVWDLIVKNNAYISVPSKNTVFYDPARGEDRTMTPEEYYDFVKESGALIKTAITKHISQLENMKSEDVRDMIKDIERSARDEVKKKIAKLSSDKEVKDNFEEEVVKIQLNKVFEKAGLKDKGGRKYSYHLSKKETESGNIDKSRVIESLNKRKDSLHDQYIKGDITKQFMEQQLKAVDKAKEEWGSEIGK